MNNRYHTAPCLNLTLPLNRALNLSLRLPLLLLTLFSSLSLIAQDSSSVHLLLKQIEDQQVKQDPFFMADVFPSYVSAKKIYTEQRKDNNIFFNAIISYTLKTLRPKLPPADQSIVDSIISRSAKLTTRFKNRNGRESYNFWRTDSVYRLPYLWGLHITKKNMLDDDQDCTSMCLLAFDVPVAIAAKAHILMQDYVNDRRDPAATTFTRYQYYAAYSTWLGNKLPPVFDVCVMTNVLSFVQTYGLPWSQADSASLDLIIATIKNRDHIANPGIIAPYYGGTAVMLYHLSRLMHIKPIPALEALKGELVNDALQELQKTNNAFEKLILCNALLKWNSNTVIPGKINITGIDKNNLPFFIGNIPSIFPVLLKKPLIKKQIGFYYHYCPAYNNVLLLEYLVLRNENEPALAVENKRTDNIK